MCIYVLGYSSALPAQTPQYYSLKSIGNPRTQAHVKGMISRLEQMNACVYDSACQGQKLAQNLLDQMYAALASAGAGVKHQNLNA